MAETRRRYDPDFRAGAIRIVTETGKSCAEVARDLGINETTLATWGEPGAGRATAGAGERAGRVRGRGAGAVAAGECRAADGA